MTLRKDYIALRGRSPHDGSFKTHLLMNPIDCLKSRLTNVNVLNRGDRHSLRQTAASVRIARHYVEELIGAGNSKEAMTSLRNMEAIVKRIHLGKPTHLVHGDRIGPLAVMTAFSEDGRLASRWRRLVLDRAVGRCVRKAESALERSRRTPSPVNAAQEAARGRGS